MSDSAKAVQFKYDAVVLHSEDEWELAERFCKTVREMDFNGRSPNVITMEAFSMPGKQKITILNEAVREARFIFVSEEYYRNDRMGNFSGNVAITKKIPDKFVKLTMTGKCSLEDDGSSEPSFESFCGLNLDPNWEISDQTQKKVEKMFLAQWYESDFVDKTRKLTLVSSNVQDEYKRPALSTEENLGHLNISNPSISSTSSLQSFNSLDETEAKCPVDTSANEGNGSDLTSCFSDLEVDNAEAEAGCADSATQNPSLQVPNSEFQTASPGSQARNPGPDAPQRGPQPSTLNPNDSQAADPGLLAQRQGSESPEQGSQPLNPGLQALGGFSGGRAPNTAFLCGTTANTVTTLQNLKDKGKPEKAFTTVAPSRTFDKDGRSMLDGATGVSVTSNPDMASMRRELMARRAEERLSAQRKHSDNDEKQSC